MTGITLSAVAAVLLAQGASAESHPDVRCGGYCLFVALDALGLAPRTYEELERQLGSAEPKGYSVARLREVAQARGAHAVAVETTIDGLRARADREKFACIALMSDEHFLALYDLDGKIAYVVDPPRTYETPVETFRKFWTGNALLISSDPLASEESLARGPWRRVVTTLAVGVALVFLFLIVRGRGVARAARTAGLGACLAAIAGCGWPAQTVTANGSPKLRLEPEAHDLGVMPIGRLDDYRDVTTFLINEGEGVLRIESVESNCSCTALELEDDHIPPGGRVRLISRIKLGSTPEARRVALKIETNDPTRPIAAPTFTWRAVPPVRAEPASVDWPTVEPGTHPSQTLVIFYRSTGRPGPFRVTCTSYAAAIESVFENQPIEASPRTVAGDEEVRLGTLQVRVREALDPGDFAQPLLLKVLAGEEEVARLSVPVSWRIRPAVEVVPNRLALGRAHAGDVVERTVLFRSTSRSAFRVASVRADDPALTLESTGGDGASPDQAVAFRLTVPDASGPWRTTLRVQTDHEKATDLELPLSAIVEPIEPASR